MNESVIFMNCKFSIKKDNGFKTSTNIIIKNYVTKNLKLIYY